MPLMLWAEKELIPVAVVLTYGDAERSVVLPIGCDP